MQISNIILYIQIYREKSTCKSIEFRMCLTLSSRSETESIRTLFILNVSVRKRACCRRKRIKRFSPAYQEHSRKARKTRFAKDAQTIGKIYNFYIKNPCLHATAKARGLFRTGLVSSYPFSGSGFPECGSDQKSPYKFLGNSTTRHNIFYKKKHTTKENVGDKFLFVAIQLGEDKPRKGSCRFSSRGFSNKPTETPKNHRANIVPENIFSQ